jgi:hypothetical protein
MGAPTSGMTAAGEPAEAAALLDAFKTIDPAERQKHQAVLEYWLSIRADRELPPLRDLDPLEISDAATSSLLLELIGGGEDAEIRHCGEQLKSGAAVDKIGEAPRPSLLSSIARKLAIVAVSRNCLAFEDDFTVDGAATRCSVTLLPFSAAGAWVDYVYAYVSCGPAGAESAEVEAPAVEVEVAESVEAEAPAEEVEVAESLEGNVLELEVVIEDDEEVEQAAESAQDSEADTADDGEVAAEPAKLANEAPGFTFDGKAAAKGFYGTQAVKVEPVMPTPPPAPSVKPQPIQPEVAQAPVEEPQDVEPVEEIEAAAEEQPQPVTSAVEGSLQSKLTDVRAKADEARAAKLRANAALYEGLGAAYDFALDAEDRPEEYLKLVEAKGLKIQLRSPMRPVVKLAFEGMCDDSTIAQLEAVLAWAIDQELPRGSLAQRIEEAGGIGPILSGEARAAA